MTLQPGFTRIHFFPIVLFSFLFSKSFVLNEFKVEKIRVKKVVSEASLAATEAAG